MLRVLIGALLVFGFVVGGAGAVTTNGFHDNGQHPNVGAVGVLQRNGDFAAVCSGTLVSQTVFLTASHCTAFLESLDRQAYVTFDETDIEPSPSGLIQATPHTNPAYKGGNRDDVSVMVLSTPVTDITP